MADQPKALRLADALQQQAVWEGHYGPSYLRDLLPEAAAELRRLHGIEFALRNCEKALEGMATKYMDAADQRDELLAALKNFVDVDCYTERERLAKARAAIAKAEGEK